MPLASAMIFTRSPLKENKEENLHLNSSYETNLESAVPSLFAYLPLQAPY